MGVTGLDAIPDDANHEACVVLSGGALYNCGEIPVDHRRRQPSHRGNAGQDRHHHPLHACVCVCAFLFVCL